MSRKLKPVVGKISLEHLELESFLDGSEGTKDPWTAFKHKDMDCILSVVFLNKNASLPNVQELTKVRLGNKI